VIKIQTDNTHIIVKLGVPVSMYFLKARRNGMNSNARIIMAALESCFSSETTKKRKYQQRTLMGLGLPIF
jgi:hypothetical protein